MEKEEFKIWVKEIKEKLPEFLNEMKANQKKGFFRYSYSGDIFNEHFNWGLGNSVFALKIYRTLNLVPENLNDIVAFIQKFQKRNGEFYDPLIRYTSLPKRLYNTIKAQDKNRLDHKFVRRAETRQSISALKLFGEETKYLFGDFPKDETGIIKFIENLNWKIPWGAAAHFSALLFFLSVSELPKKNNLVNFTIKYIDKFRQKNGCWYSGKPNLQLKINGAMKIITGLKAAATFANWNGGNIFFKYAKELIDTALLAANDKNACSNFNLTYTLRYANEITSGTYKYQKIEKFIKTRLDIYKQFYFDNYGAFSFYESKANSNYYGAYISMGKNEPDIHGTVMFMWGLAVIGNFWGINEELGLYEFVT
jgi:hypothetical protein